MNRRTFLASSAGTLLVHPAFAGVDEPFVGHFNREGARVTSTWTTEVKVPLVDVAGRFRDWGDAARLIKDAIDVEVRRQDKKSADVYLERSLFVLLPNLKVLMRMTAGKPEAKRAEVTWRLLEGTPKSLWRRWTLEAVGDERWTRVRSELKMELPFSPPDFIEQNASEFLVDDVRRLSSFLNAKGVRRPRSPPRGP